MRMKKDKDRDKGRSRDRDRDKDKFQREKPFGFQKRKWSPVLETNVKEVDFKDVKLLSRAITERGRILPRKITGLNAQQQRVVTKAVKRARQMSLLPYISYGS